MRVYRIESNPAGNLDVVEIGPRLVLLPTRIIASGFGGAILQVYLPGLLLLWLGVLLPYSLWRHCHWLRRCHPAGAPAATALTLLTLHAPSTPRPPLPSAHSPCSPLFAVVCRACRARPTTPHHTGRARPTNHPLTAGSLLPTYCLLTAYLPPTYHLRTAYGYPAGAIAHRREISRGGHACALPLTCALDKVSHCQVDVSTSYSTLPLQCTCSVPAVGHGPRARLELGRQSRK
jgi:hypothetical protein